MVVAEINVAAALWARSDSGAALSCCVELNGWNARRVAGGLIAVARIRAVFAKPPTLSMGTCFDRLVGYGTRQSTAGDALKRSRHRVNRWLCAEAVIHLGPVTALMTVV